MIPLRHTLLKGTAHLIANQALYLYLFKQALRGATDEEIRAAGHLPQTRMQLVLKGVIFDSGEIREDHVVWKTDHYVPNHPPARSIVQPPSTVELSRYGLGLGSPPDSIPQCARGSALALAAITLELFTGTAQRLVWVVDFQKDVTLTADDLKTLHPLEPADTSPKGGWGDLLFRLRGALDRQRWGSFDCEFAMWVHLHVRSTNTWAWALFGIPWKIDLTCIPGRPPPAGKWLLQPLPPRVGEDRSMERHGDQHPGDWFHSGTPF